VIIMSDLPDELPIRLLRTQKTLVLATTVPDPWAAPVYFVYARRRLYFFSSAESRHVTAGLAAQRCAGAVYRDSADWRQIEGLQMDGGLAPIRDEGEALDAFRRYVTKFPTVSDFFDGPFNLTDFTERFRSQLYAFVPHRVYYLNNAAGFGKRQEIQLTE
jgi:uncharacterized protein YhbP (UPF0306 family)